MTNKPKNKPTNVVITEPLRKRLIEYALKKHWSVSYIIREALEAYLEKNK